MIERSKVGLEWWARELLSLIPERVKRAVSADTEDVQLYCDRGRLRIIRSAGDDSGADKSDALPTETENAVAWAYLAQNSGTASSPSVSLCLPSLAYLEREIVVPASARGDLDRIAKLDLERTTPFREGDVLSASIVTPNTNASGKLLIRQFLVKLDAVRSIISDIEHTGAKVRKVVCLDKSGSGVLPVNFMPPDRIGKSRRLGVFQGLAALSLLLVASAIGISAVRSERALAELELKTAKARGEWQEREAAASAFITKRDEANAIAALKAKYVPTVLVLEELTRVLPDEVSITDLKLSERTVFISGLARSSASLVPIIEASRLFADVQLAASVTIDAATDKERFSLRFRLEGSSPEKTADVEEAPL